MRNSKPRCPFYGFEWPNRTTALIHTGGNQCGLCLGAYEPCEMEMHGLCPYMYECRIALRYLAAIETISTYLRFHPPHHPEGISYRDWHTEVMVRR